jgi:hypothetical protein
MNGARRRVTRWTAYDGLYPMAHAASKAGAVRIAKAKGREVTHVVQRLRGYPFTHLRQEKL